LGQLVAELDLELRAVQAAFTTQAWDIELASFFPELFPLQRRET
jgi:hypothetical protein